VIPFTKHHTEQHNETTMADQAGASAPAEANKTYLDEVTGEQVSKSELKKRQKARQKEEEKQKKAAAAPPRPVAVKKGNAEADEEKLNPNVRLFALCS
jgi:lysyl-tRNA synthetase class 2